MRQAANRQAREDLGNAYELVEVGKAATFDGLTETLEIEERFGAMIDKYLKQLLFLRGLKSVSTSSTAAPRQLPPGSSRAA